VAGSTSDVAPKDVLSPKVKQWVKDLAQRTRDKTAGKTTESRKQAGVTAIGAAVGTTLSVIAAPIVVPVVLHGGFVAASSVVLVSSTGNYVAVAGAKKGTKYFLETEDANESTLDAQDALIEIGVNCASAGLVTIPGIDHAVRGGATAGMHATQETIRRVGDAAVWTARGHIKDGIQVAQFSIEKLIEIGLEVIYEEDGSVTITNPNDIPTVQAELTGMGILLGIILDNIHSTGEINFGSAFVQYDEMNRDLTALRTSALKTVGPERRAQGDGWVRLGMAERILADIVYPSYDPNWYIQLNQGKRFPSCMDLKPGQGQIDGATGASQVPLCYCWKHGFNPLGQTPPKLGVDVDFCLNGQMCAPGSGAENAHCFWVNDQAKQIVGRMFKSMATGSLNCVGQHLAGYRCPLCAKKTGQTCMTELGEGVCTAMTTMPGKQSSGCIHGFLKLVGLEGCQVIPDFTCLRPGETIDSQGRKSITPPGIVLQQTDDSPAVTRVASGISPRSKWFVTSAICFTILLGVLFPNYVRKHTKPSAGVPLLG